MAITSHQTIALDRQEKTLRSLERYVALFSESVCRFYNWLVNSILIESCHLFFITRFGLVQQPNIILQLVCKLPMGTPWIPQAK